MFILNKVQPGTSKLFFGLNNIQKGGRNVTFFGFNDENDFSQQRCIECGGKMTRKTVNWNLIKQRSQRCFKCFLGKNMSKQLGEKKRNRIIAKKAKKFNVTMKGRSSYINFLQKKETEQCKKLVEAKKG